MLNKLAVIAIVTMAMPALAHAMPQTQDEWIVDSGHYLNNQVPFYNQDVGSDHVLVDRVGGRPARIIEGRSSATVGTFESLPKGLISTGRDYLVNAF